MAKIKQNRLITNADSILNARVNSEVQELVARMVSSGRFLNKSEVLLEALFQMANRLGFERASGGKYTTLAQLEQMDRHLLVHKIGNGTTPSTGERRLIEQLAR